MTRASPRAFCIFFLLNDFLGAWNRLDRLENINEQLEIKELRDIEVQ